MPACFLFFVCVFLCLICIAGRGGVCCCLFACEQPKLHPNKNEELFLPIHDTCFIYRGVLYSQYWYTQVAGKRGEVRGWSYTPSQ